MLQSVVETPDYLRDADRARLQSGQAGGADYQHGFARFDGEDAAAGLEGDRRVGLLGHRAGVSATLP